jgi:hypothetical protein
MTVMSERSHEDALREADDLVGRLLEKLETRCRMLAYYIADCERKGARTAAWSEAVRELSVLHGDRSTLLRRRDFIRQALDCSVAERAAETVLEPARDQTSRRPQPQVQIQRSTHRR